MEIGLLLSTTRGPLDLNSSGGVIAAILSEAVSWDISIRSVEVDRVSYEVSIQKAMIISDSSFLTFSTVREVNKMTAIVLS